MLDITSVYPADMTDMLMSLIADDIDNRLSAVILAIVADRSAYAVRGTSHEITEICLPPFKGQSARKVKAGELKARFAGALPIAYFRTENRRSEELKLDLYGYMHTAGLAVYQVRRGYWDGMRKSMRTKKRYVVVDVFGNSIKVPHNKIRSAARLHVADLELPVIGALQDAFDLSASCARFNASRGGMVNLQAMKAEIEAARAAIAAGV